METVVSSSPRRRVRDLALYLSIISPGYGVSALNFVRVLNEPLSLSFYYSTINNKDLMAIHHQTVAVVTGANKGVRSRHR